VTWLAYSALGVPKRVELTTQPAGAQAGIAFTVQPVGRLVDGSGLLARVQGTTVTASRVAGAGTLSGTTAQATVDGVFTYTNLAMSLTEAAVQLGFASSGLTSVTSNLFNVTTANTIIGIAAGAYTVTGTAVTLTRGPYMMRQDASGSYTVTGAAVALAYSGAAVLFTETFADSSFASRGWYDLSTTDRVASPAPSGLPGSLRMTWTAGQTNASTRTMRRLFTPTDRVYIKYQQSFSANWVGSGQLYHPHMAMCLSELDGDYGNTADSFLAFYCETNYQSGNRPTVKFQDNQYVDAAHIGSNTGEARATCGANAQQGYADSWDLYADGALSRGWYNSRNLVGAVQMSPGNTAWHTVEVEVVLNSVSGGIGQTDGICRYWWDGVLVWERTNLIMRTGTRSALKFSQFLLTPYIGDGSPVTQTTYIGDLTVATARPTTFDPYANRPAGYSNVVTDYAFSAVLPTSPSDVSIGDGSGWSLSSAGSLARVSDATAPRSAPYAAQWTYPPGHTAGTSVGKFYRSVGSATSFYISLAVWHDSNFDFNTVSNKFVTFFNSDGGTDLLETSHNGSPWVWQFERPSTTILYGPTTAFGNALTLAGLRGTWWNVEIQYVGGVGSGVVRVWAGRSDGSDGPVGQLIMEHTGINVYLPAPEFQLDSTWGGGPPETPSQTSYRRIDHFYMSHP
jgi:hypothetical protein